MVAEVNWSRVDDYHQRSDCSRYRVCAVRLEGVCKFEAWYCASGKDQNLSIFEEAAQGRRACENHASKPVSAA